MSLEEKLNLVWDWQIGLDVRDEWCRSSAHIKEDRPVRFRAEESAILNIVCHLGLVVSIKTLPIDDLPRRPHPASRQQFIDLSAPENPAAQIAGRPEPKSHQVAHGVKHQQPKPTAVAHHQPAHGN